MSRRIQKRLTASRARILLLKPRENTGLVEDMLARKLLPRNHFVPTNQAHSVPISLLQLLPRYSWEHRVQSVHELPVVEVSNYFLLQPIENVSDIEEEDGIHQREGDSSKIENLAVMEESHSKYQAVSEKINVIDISVLPLPMRVFDDNAYKVLAKVLYSIKEENEALQCMSEAKQTKRVGILPQNSRRGAHPGSY